MPLTTVFAERPDPRREPRNAARRRPDILLIATGAVISGAESRESLAESGRTQHDVFRRSRADQRPTGRAGHPGG